MTPISCVPLMLYATLHGSDRDKWFCPQPLLMGLGGMRRGIIKGERKETETEMEGRPQPL